MPMTKRILVVGGRAFKDWRLMWRVLGEIKAALDEKHVIVTWNSIDEKNDGAVRLARKFARENDLLWVENLFADLSLVVAFPGATGSAESRAWGAFKTPTARALQHAWRKRIPALKVFADGNVIVVGSSCKQFFATRKAAR
jgi:hypothetical protein